MGVRGLQTFLKNNSSLLSERVELKDTTLVIDGNNLFCLLFCQSCNDQNSPDYRSDIYGGNLVAYAQLVERFFDNLKKCNITPILIYDGSVIGKQSTRDQVILKDKETYRRGLERFLRAKEATEENVTPDEIFLPKNVNRVFKEIAARLGHQCIQAPYEADSLIAGIANDLNCPVLTNDSDFFIYELEKGFILLDYFFYNRLIPSNDGKHAIESFLFSQSSLMKVAPGLKIENMPLLSIFLGNDYLDTNAFFGIIQDICYGRHNDPSPFRAESKSNLKIACLLGWMRLRKFDEVVDHFQARLEKSIAKEFRVMLPKLIMNYKIQTSNNLEAELEVAYPPDLDPRANVAPEHVPKVYLNNLLRSGKLSSTILDIIFRNIDFNYPLVDDFQLPSSSIVKYRPFAVTVTLLRDKSFLNMTTYRRQVEAEKCAFVIYDRIGNEYKRYAITPLDELEGFGTTLHLNCFTLTTLDSTVKLSILMATFRFNEHEADLFNETLSNIFSESFAIEARLCLLLIKYIALETGLKPKPQFVDAIILTFFYYAAIQGQLKPNTFEDNHYGKLLLRLRPHSNSNNGITYKPSVGLYKRIVHFINELCHAYSAYIILNGILDHVYHIPHFEKFFNSVLIFRLTKLFRLRQLDMDELCDQMSSIIDASNTIKTIVNCDAA